MNFHVNSKNKKPKIVFSFVSVHCAPFKKVESKLRGRGLLVVSWDRDKIQNRLNQKKNQIPDFYFSSYGHFCFKKRQFSIHFSRYLDE